ncbi:hypothetical protein GW17_00019338 [Ensete ventricosum]|nr:hypothetical protein GW17_00019338 [Ensete ventricosum]
MVSSSANIGIGNLSATSSVQLLELLTRSLLAQQMTLMPLLLEGSEEEFLFFWRCRSPVNKATADELKHEEAPMIAENSGSSPPNEVCSTPHLTSVLDPYIKTLASSVRSDGFLRQSRSLIAAIVTYGAE